MQNMVWCQNKKTYESVFFLQLFSEVMRVLGVDPHIIQFSTIATHKSKLLSYINYLTTGMIKRVTSQS